MATATPESQEHKPATLCMYDDRVVWASAGFTGADSARPAIALLIGARAALTVTSGGRTLRARALLIAPQVVRSLDAQGAGFYSLNLDPAHRASRYLRRQVLAQGSIIDLSAQLTDPVIAAVNEVIDNGGDCASNLRASDVLISHFFPETDAAADVDARVRRVTDYLNAQVPVQIDLDALAAMAHLSRGRLTHLVSEELGVSLRSYLLWVKMRKAAELFSEDMSVTDVAMRIGFSDSAHLSRVFRTYFSVAPSVLANPARVRVHACRTRR